MNKKALITIASVITIFVIGFAIYLFTMPKNDTPITPTAPSSSTAPSPSASKTSEPVSDDKEEVEKDIEKIGSIDVELQESIEGFSNAEIKEATEFVSNYAQATHTNTYFLGGDWAKEGGKVKDMQGFLNAFYSKDIVDGLDKLEGKQGTEEFADKMTTLVPFFDDTTIYSPSKYCSTEIAEQTNEIVPDISCAEDLVMSDINFTSVKEGEGYYLRAEFEVRAKLALYSKELNADAFTNSHYKYVTRLDKHILDENTSEWRITGYTITPSLSKIQQWK